MPNALLVARREYIVRVRSRAFVISTIILALIAFAAGIAPAVLAALDREATTKIAIHVDAPDLAIDPVGAANTVLNAGALQAGDSARRSFDISLAPDLARARVDLNAGRYAGILVIGRAASGKLTFDYISDIAPGGRQAVIMQLAAVWIAIEDGLQRSGLAPSTGGGGPYESFVVDAPDSTTPSQPTEVQSVARLIVATVLIILIFITAMTYGMWIAVSVAEEKNSRVMDLMLSAASPVEMLAGKVLGVGAAGLTQYAAIVGTALVGLLSSQAVEAALVGDGGPGGALEGLTVGILAAFLVFFVLGFALNALLYAAAGSLVSRQEDVQQVAMPMIVLSMVGYFLSSFAIQAIDSSWVAPLSFVPFFAPYLMLARLTVGRVEPWELALAIAILLGSIIVAVGFAARVYRAGVLLYGQRPGLRSFYRALRLAK